MKTLLCSLRRRFLLIPPLAALLLSFLWPLPLTPSGLPAFIEGEFAPHAAVTLRSPVPWVLGVCLLCLVADSIWSARSGRYGKQPLGALPLAALCALSCGVALLCADGEWLRNAWYSSPVRIGLSVCTVALFFRAAVLRAARRTDRRVAPLRTAGVATLLALLLLPWNYYTSGVLIVMWGVAAVDVLALSWGGAVCKSPDQ